MARATERTYYPELINVIEKLGGKGAQEVNFNSEPDIVFSLADRTWLLGVKIGEDATTLRKAFLQYLRHKDESHLQHGILLFLPQSARKVPPDSDSLRRFITNKPVFALLDTPTYRDERRGLAFPDYLREVVLSTIPKLDKGEHQSFSLNLAISLLKEHLQTLMQAVKLDEDEMLGLMTNPDLFSNLAHLESSRRERVGKFLASYIILSQILFLRLLGKARPDLLPLDLQPVTPSSLRRAFKRVLEINYRPIYAHDVLNSLDDQYIVDTFDIIWGLRVEEVQYELPGRIYHELMPENIRKMLAAFYTRPIAADLMAKLCIDRSDSKVLDPACGSGTILVAAYKRKRDCYYREGKVGNPHRSFCEEQIYGVDIMPFSVHLTAANLAAADPAITLERTQIALGDSLKLGPEGVLSTSLGQLNYLFPEEVTGFTTKGQVIETTIPKADVILMNPPFTKVERGVRDYIDLERFKGSCGGEVGLWGHFITLAYEFLKPGGILGAVIPINVLRGRESHRVRSILFEHMTPIFVLKPVVNYGFSEWAEYRDIIVVARKTKPSKSYKTKFVLVKRNLNSLSNEDIDHFNLIIRTEDKYLDSSTGLQVQSFSRKEMAQYSTNLMWFCGVTDYRHREQMISFLDKCKKGLSKFPPNYFRGGYRLAEGLAKCLFVTRALDPSRIEQAFLAFKSETKEKVNAFSESKLTYPIEKEVLVTSLRTPTGINTLSVEGKHDYIASRPYHEMWRVAKAAGLRLATLENASFWNSLRRNLDAISTFLVVSRRLNPFSPNNSLVSFFSPTRMSPADTFHTVLETNIDRAKSLAVMFNSIVFWVQFFLLKEESTGRWVDIRLYDLDGIVVNPEDSKVNQLVQVFDSFCDLPFPSFAEQVDMFFSEHYRDYRSQDSPQLLFDFGAKSFTPSPIRLEFDLAVCKAMGFPIHKEDLLAIYEILAKEMLVTKALARE